MIGTKVVHRLMMNGRDGHYPGDLVDGARILHYFGDVATELMIRAEGDMAMGLGYDDLRFTAPVHVGDFMEYHGWIDRKGNTSFILYLEAYKVITMPDDFKIDHHYLAGVISEPNLIGGASSAAVVLDPPVLCATAKAILIVAKDRQRGAQDPAFIH